MQPNEIKAALVLRGISITSISMQCGADRSNVGKAITGRVKTPYIRQAIADAIGKPVSEVFPDTKK